MHNNDIFAIRGNLCWCVETNRIETMEHGYLVCEHGICKGVFQELPAMYADISVQDYGENIIIPGLVDLHLHAPQFTFRGLGMDMELLEWLNTNTFPEEAKYADLAYAKKAYELFAEEMKQGMTTRACIFATVHREATKLLMDLMEQAGLHTMVGKVNMDRNAPADLCESFEDSMEETVRWLEEIAFQYQNTKAIITPRFIPSCSDELMKGLAKVRARYGLPVQSHLSENKSEIEWVLRLCKEARNYADAYDRLGMFGGDYPTVMAHCVHLEDEEIALMKQNGVYVAHCPQSNTNLASGIAPVRRYLDEGLQMGLGTDVAGGYSTSIMRAMTDAIQVSKLRYSVLDHSLAPITLSEAFYLATKGGGSFFGRVGSFEEGYEFDAVVIDDSALKSAYEMKLLERLERLVYLPEKSVVVDKYVAGNVI